jgi:hypothetical protein
MVQRLLQGVPIGQVLTMVREKFPLATDEQMSTAIGLFDFIVHNADCPATMNTEQGLEKLWVCGERTFQLTGSSDAIAVRDSQTLVVYDWKFYHDDNDLPEMEEDMQMLAYGLLALNQYKVQKRAIVYRVNGYRPSLDSFVIVSQDKHWPVVEKIFYDFADTQNTFSVGSHCIRCFAKTKCREVQTKQPGTLSVVHQESKYLQETFQDVFFGREKITRNNAGVLMAVCSAVGARLDEIVDDVKSLAREEPIVFGEKKYGESVEQHDAIADPVAATARLTEKFGVDASVFCKYTKKSIEDGVLECGGNVREVMTELKKDGLLCKVPVKKLKWSKL